MNLSLTLTILLLCGFLAVSHGFLIDIPAGIVRDRVRALGGLLAVSDGDIDVIPPGIVRDRVAFWEGSKKHKIPLGIVRDRVKFWKDLEEQPDSDHIDILVNEFVKYKDGSITSSELKAIIRYLMITKEYNIEKSSRDLKMKKIAHELYPLRDIICPQDVDVGGGSVLRRALSKKLNIVPGIDINEIDKIVEATEKDIDLNLLDPIFDTKFHPTDMRYLALVSNDGMKTTMKDFVIANKNLLTKFRLTGTRSTMTMLREVFRNEPDNTVFYGKTCESGPLGGDAELVGLMVDKKIGGILFFRDPMDTHPHRVDIDCLVRQGLVHNVMMGCNTTSALMLVQCLRLALQQENKVMIPSFFDSLKCPTVAAYIEGRAHIIDNA